MPAYQQRISIKRERNRDRERQTRGEEERGLLKHKSSDKKNDTDRKREILPETYASLLA